MIKAEGDRGAQQGGGFGEKKMSTPDSELRDPYVMANISTNQLKDRLCYSDNKI